MRKIISFFIVTYSLVTNVFATMFLNVSFINKTNQIKNNIQSAETGINEQDFINTMFLKPEFFENWAETNYFINPTLKTSKPLQYSKTWYLDYMKDSFSSGFTSEPVNQQFLDFINSKIEDDIYIWKNYFSLEQYWKKQVLTTLPPDLTDLEKQKVINFFPKTRDNFLHDLFYLLLNAYGYQKNEYFFNKFLSILIKNHFDYFDYKSDFSNWPYQDLNFVRRYCWVDLLKKEFNNKHCDFKHAIDKVTANLTSMPQVYITIANELVRVNNGGLPIYDDHITGLTQKILFSFEIIDENKDKRKVYKMLMTVDKNNNIFAGNLQLIYNSQKGAPLNELNFSLNWTKKQDNSFNGTLQLFSFTQQGRQLHSDLRGTIDINLFLEKFFSSALIPVFQNRSSFIESDYLNAITYDTVLINFFGLNEINFKGLFLNIDYDKVTKYDAGFKNLLNLSKSFYKDYLRILFDMDNKTYVQGYNKEYGLLANNGFKIYPRYFYFSDRYSYLTVNLYSAYQNRFYKTKFGNVFNYDYSIADSKKLQGNEPYTLTNKVSEFPFKYLFLDSRKIGYNVFELKAERQDNIYKYYYFNFGIYNWQEITKDGLMPDKQWWDTNYESCSWYNIFCHMKNVVKWTVNTIPGVSEAVKLVSGVGEIYKSTVNFFQDIFEFWKFSPAMYHTVTSLFILIVFMKLVRFI